MSCIVYSALLKPRYSASVRHTHRLRLYSDGQHSFNNSLKYICLLHCRVLKLIIKIEVIKVNIKIIINIRKNILEARNRARIKQS